MKYRLFYPIIMLMLLVSPVSGASISYFYDDLDRLKAVTFENGKNIVYEYDQIGNMISKTGPQCAAGTSYNSATNWCEALPTCGSGTYSAATNNCVSGGTYAAVMVGGALYDRPVRMASAQYWGSVYAGIIGYTPANTILNVNFSGARAVRFGMQQFDMGDWTPVSYYMEPVIWESFFSYADDRTGTYHDVYSSPTGTGYIAPTPGTYGGTYTCPSGGTLSGTSCNTTTYTPTTCPSGTLLDAVADRCVGDLT